MHAAGEADRKPAEELKRELSNATAALASSKFNRLKIEPGLYEKFLKQINDRFSLSQASPEIKKSAGIPQIFS